MSTLPTRFKRNALSNYLSTFVSIVMAVGVTPLLVRGLGKEAYGVWGLAMSAVLYFGLLNVGFGRATVKFVAASHARNDERELRRVVATSAFSLMLPGLFILAISPGLAFLFPVLFHVPHSLLVPAMVLVVLSCVDLAFAISSDTFGATLMGLQRYDFLNLTLASTALAQAAAWTVIVLLGGGLIALGVATVTFSFMGQFARYVLVRREVGADVLRRRNFSRRLVRKLLGMSGWIALSEVSDTVIAELDALVVGLVAGVPQAAVYLVGQKLAGLGAGFTSPVAALFYPHAAALAAKEDHDALRATVYAGTRISLAIAIPLLLVLAMLAKPALHIWVGPGYEQAALVVIFLSANQVIATVPRAAVYVLRGMGEVRMPALFTSLEAALNLPLSVVLGLTIGFQGVALGTLIAGAIVSLGLLLPYACRRAGISTASMLLAVLRTNLPATVVSLAVGLLLRHQGIVLAGGVIGVIGVLLAGAAMLLAYLLVLFLTGLSGAERGRVLEAVRLRLRRTEAALDGAGPHR
ncbi:MAG TPA: oligosaccharide flippase family protein [Solirubrobacteraceae bacterium]|jgi:O-antigen/teichoic acid export membrane protein